MRLPMFALVALVAALPAMAAQQPARPVHAQKNAPVTFSVGKPLPKWAQPLAAIAPTGRHDPLVYRLQETQAWVAPNPAVLVNRAVQANDQSALGDIGQVGIDYFPAYQKLSLHRVAILRGDQVLDRTRSVNTRMLQREQNLEGGVYGGATTVQLLLDDVRVGDTLWLTYTTEGANPVFDQHWSDEFSWDKRAPVELRRLTVLHPRRLPLYWRQLGDVGSPRLEPVIDQVGDLERLRFEGTALEPVEMESAMPADFVPGRVVQMSQYANWQGVATWAAGLFPRAAPSPALQKLARQFDNLASPAAKAAAALHWVQDEIRYFSVSIGENSHRPQPPDTVLARRYGDCKDKSYLLVSLLAQLGIKAEPMLIDARAPRLPAKLIATHTMFDHVIVRIELDGKTYDVDPTQAGQKGALAQLPLPFPGGFGLLVDPATQGLAALPERPDSELPVERVENVSIPDFDGDATMEARVIYRGAYADWARRRYPLMSASELKKDVLGDYEKLYPGVSLLEPPRIEDHVDQGRFELVARLKLPKPVARKDDLHTFEYESHVMEDTLGIPDKLVRNFPLALPQGKYHGRYRLNLTWPKTVRDLAQPAAKSIDNPFFALAEEYTFRGNYLSYMLDYRTKSDRVAASDLPALQKEAKKLNEFASASFRVADRALVEPEGMGFAYREIDSMRAAARSVAWAASVKGRKDSELDIGEMCENVENFMHFSDLDSPQVAAAGHAALRKGLEGDTRPGMAQCLARALFAGGEFAKSVPLFQSAPALADADPLVVKLAWARMYAGDDQGAAADMARYVAARTRAGELSGFDVAAAIALLQRAGQPVAPGLLAHAGAIPDGPWPHPLLAMQAGLLTPEALHELVNGLPADAREIALNDAWFYIGQRRLAGHDRDGAAAAFRWYAANGLRGADNSVMAKGELALLEPDDAETLAGAQAAQRGDHAAALALWRKGAQRGVAQAQYRLGYAYYDGDGVGQDYVAALRWFRLAAGQRHGPALNMVGLMHERGEGTPPDMAAALDWYRRGAEVGHRVALSNLGKCYRYGTGVEKDDVRAAEYFRQAAGLNFAEAQAELSRLYEDGRGVARDYAQAAFWAREASMHGSKKGDIVLARLLWNGNGVEKNPELGTRTLRAVADDGDSDAQDLMGDAYEAGRGVAKDIKTAIAWWEQAARQGNLYSQESLGATYLYGDDGVPRDYDKARKWLEKPVAAGYGYAESQLGVMYQFGYGVGKDPARAAALYRLSAEHGNHVGQELLGLMLRHGNGIDKNPVEAAQWLRKAADKGWYRAINELADMYENGDGVEKDYAKAISLYREAAEGGYGISLYSIGTLYERGMGFAENPRMAYLYYRLAADAWHSDSGRKKATERRDLMAKRVGADDLAKADSIAAAWKPKTPLPE